MADEPAQIPKRRLIKKVESVRERAEKASAEPKPRRLHKTTRRISAPFRATGRAAGRVGKLKPFRILGFIIVPPYFRNSWKELRQVTWPTFRVSVRLTTAVVIFSVIFGVVVAVLDFGLDKLFREVLLK
jgi:preprotein translocase SecE subunit